jgi:hypothetical protein
MVDPLRRRAASGRPATRLKALRIATDLRLIPRIAPAVVGAATDGDAKLRSKAVLLLAEVLEARPEPSARQALHSALNDADPRVRANAIETLARLGEEGQQAQPLLDERARLGRNRERANAIVAMRDLQLGSIDSPLFEMLRDGRELHRLSAVWAAERTASLGVFDEVARLARSDVAPAVRRSALSAVRRIAMGRRAGAIKVATGVAIATCLSATASSSATLVRSRAEEIRAGFGGDAGAGAVSIGGPWLAAVIMILSGGVALGLIIKKFRRYRRERLAGGRTLGRIRKTLHLRRSDMRLLGTLSSRVGAKHPATLLICPSLLHRLRSRCTGPESAAIDRVLSTLTA